MNGPFTTLARRFGSYRPRADDEQLVVHVGIGLPFCGTLMTIYSIIVYFAVVRGTSHEPAALAGWTLFAIAIAIGLIWICCNGLTITTPLLTTVLALAGCGYLIDFVGSLLSAAPSAIATVIGGLCGLLLAITPLRPLREMLTIVSIVAVLQFAPLVLPAINHNGFNGRGLSSIILVVLALSLALSLSVSLRRMMSMARDRARLHGSLATQLPDDENPLSDDASFAHLDREIETFFTDVAAGRIDLPLPPAYSSRASELATALRSHLRAENHESWLVYAITQSSVLTGVFTVDDRHGLAARLPSNTRDPLISALWLLCTDLDRSELSGAITLSHVLDDSGSPRPDEVRIEIVADGVRRGSIGPNVWELLSHIGPQTTQVSAHRLHLNITAQTR